MERECRRGRRGEKSEREEGTGRVGGAADAGDVPSSIVVCCVRGAGWAWGDCGARRSGCR